MELLMIGGLIVLVVLLARQLDMSAKRTVREMEDAELDEAVAEALGFNERESIYYDELARRNAIRARFAQ